MTELHRTYGFSLDTPGAASSVTARWLERRISSLLLLDGPLARLAARQARGR